MTDPVRSAALRWPDRWRLPDLLTALAGDPPDDTELARAVLAGLADPPAAPTDAVRRLAAAGEFTCAETLDVNADAIDEARQRYRRDTQHRIALLSARAHQVGLTEPPPPGILAAAERRSADADLMLDELTARVDAAARAQAERLTTDAARLAGTDHPDWLATVRECLAAGEIVAAQRMVAHGPSSTEALDPLAVPRPSPWPYVGQPLPHVLAWYDDPDEGTAGFRDRWLPPPADRDGWRLVTALRAVADEVTADTVTILAGAVDALCGADGIAHRARPMPGGYLASLGGLVDGRLSRLALRRSTLLWVPTDPGPLPASGDELILVYGPAPADPPLGRPVAYLPETELLRLVAPHRGSAPSPRHRLINLLRIVYRQLPVDTVWPRRSRSRGEGLDRARDDLRWTFDLLGGYAPSAVVEGLLHETAGHPALLLAALRTLVPAPGERAPITADDLTDWRTRPQNRHRQREALTDLLRGAPDARVLLDAVVWAHGDDPTAMFTAAGARELVAELVAPTELSPSFNVDVALAAAVATGLIRRTTPDRYVLAGPGVASAATAPGIDLVDAIRTEVDTLRETADRTEHAVRARAQEALIRGQSHLIANWVAARAGLHRTLLEAGDDLPDDVRRQIDTRIAELDAKLNDEPPYWDTSDERWLTPDRHDLAAVLRATHSQHQAACGSAVDIRLDCPDDPHPVYLPEHVLRIALDNLVRNAVDALDDRPNAAPVVELRLTREAASERFPDGAFAVHVEDGGAGIPDGHRDRLWSPIPFSTKGTTGQGLTDARWSAEHCGGTLSLADAPSRHGGAHFVLRLSASLLVD
ncbi:sensor histidine kinase [Actinocatenispora rupis]|uniref:histidine kinase n=1 Tax=Actinocatenispora rupis TaxID=519421 RepID=A0A8J3J959_9ACTN|nr:HAMP domain-containing sensor histidine kinase [Actinocatenispora rupis]GID12384.1 hypothetical protein Aru02nite_32730 [Actinocatenispora rupis]